MDTFNSNQMPGLNPEPEKKSIGPLVAVIIILVLIVIGGLYFLRERATQNVLPPIEAPVVETLEQGMSDEVGAIESDLQNTDLNQLDMSNLEAQIQAEIGL